MATMAKATIPYLLLLLVILVSAASVFSTEGRDDPERRLQQCRLQCQQRQEGRTEREERLRCEQRCEKEYQERREDDNRHDRRGEEAEQQESPYVFDRRSFKHHVRTEQGYVKVLKKFHKVSKLLHGIRNYRVAILEANPRSFIIPTHSDADCICYVVQGRGALTTIEKEEKESYAIREGDVFVTRAGALTYLVNSDGSQKLVIAKVIRTISVPGKVELFFGPGGRRPESFYRSFSRDVLAAAFNTPAKTLERVFGKQGKGIIIRASEEQVRALSHHAEGGHSPHWPFGESRGPFHLLDRRARKSSNRHGKLYEADAENYHKLADLDIKVSLANVTAGSMTAPFYNTRSTKIAIVTGGNGHVEIVCSHLAGGRSRRGGRSERGEEKWHEEEEEKEEEGQEGEEEQQEGQGYQKVRARLTRGTVFVVPPGHPVVEVASGDEDLQTVCFEVPAENNERVFLAGRNNVLKKLDREAKELAFDASAREVDEVLNAQREEVFLAGPEESHREEEEAREGRRRGRGHGSVEERMEAILEAAAGL